jgi:hypothetical protein
VAGLGRGPGWLAGDPARRNHLPGIAEPAADAAQM